MEDQNIKKEIIKFEIKFCYICSPRWMASNFPKIIQCDENHDVFNNTFLHNNVLVDFLLLMQFYIHENAKKDECVGSDKVWKHPSQTRNHFPFITKCKVKTKKMPSSQPKMCLHRCEWMRVYIFFGPMNGMCAFNGMKTCKPVPVCMASYVRKFEYACMSILQPITIKEEKKTTKKKKKEAKPSIA